MASARVPTWCLVVAALSCGGPSESDALFCGDVANVYSLDVVDVLGNPVAGLEPIVRDTRTGERVSVTAQVGRASNNRYPVVSDFERGMIGPQGDTLHFQATNSTGSVSADLVFRLGACHVEQVGGPSSAILR